MTGIYLRNKIEEIKIKLKNGVLSYNEAKEQANPVIEEMNKIGSEISKKYGKKFQKFNFVNLMR